MASSETPPPSIWQGARIVPPDSDSTVEEVLLAVGQQVGHDQMNRAVVVFLKDEPHVHQLFIRDIFVQVSPLSAPSTRITVSGVPPFIPNKLLESELRRLASGFRTLSLGCRDVRHVQSLRRQAFMFLDSPTQTLEVSFRVRHGDGHYVVYASSRSMKCFKFGDVGHKREGQGLSTSQVSGEDMEYDSESDSVSTVGATNSYYSLEEVNQFLDETFGRSVRVQEYFEDTDKFIKTVAALKRKTGFDQLDEKKRFRLKKHITTLRKDVHNVQTHSPPSSESSSRRQIKTKSRVQCVCHSVNLSPGYERPSDVRVKNRQVRTRRVRAGKDSKNEDVN
ncbi:hypothetical protein F2P81_024717 [Scophthalmus maximus]|uniref:Uncharacterized protein n=1 Tax=Scophthalmus maximus TaxID=52904 RepID=A0A6A4RJT2_SCOMX|nr:hypothetical protein F2P81_024717 [Scophthalmus maximus]